MTKYILTFLTGLVITFTNPINASNTIPNKQVYIVLLMDNGDDKQVVENILTTMVSAEKVSKLLDIEMIASENPIEDDVFIFALKTEEEKELTLKMFDEEGYELSAHRIFEVEQGNTYKSLNVESLSDGSYIFQLTDSEGQELSKTINIKRK
jgi:hypothetical protein